MAVVPNSLAFSEQRVCMFRIARIVSHLLATGASIHNGASPSCVAAIQDLSKDEAWASEPWGDRHKDLKIHTRRPFNAEPAPQYLTEYITPAGLHYRRQHYPVPVVDASTYKLKIVIEGGAEREFSLDDLRSQFVKHLVPCAFTCTGNRRGEFNSLRKTDGLPWWIGSISNAVWGGVLLFDVLRACGVSEEFLESQKLEHCQFLGLEGYEVSIDSEKAFGRRSDTLIAFEMNNDVLPRDHGFPLRMVVPGYTGARNVKWLQQITLARSEVISPYQTGVQYKALPPNIKGYSEASKDLIASTLTCMEVPVLSAIALPFHQSSITRAAASSGIPCKGYAWCGGGRGIQRVDISGDGGKTWAQAKILSTPAGVVPQKLRSKRCWAWVQWEALVQVPATQSLVELVCKAVDDQYNVQPDSIVGIWNIRGILNNAWHRITVDIQ